MDPYKVLGLKKNFTLNELKSAYKKNVIKYHPDLNTSAKSTPLFQALTEAYKILLEDLKLREDQPTHYQLKSEYEKSRKGDATNTCSSSNNSNNNNNKQSNNRFDLKQFNEVFERSRLQDDYIDSGYDNWLKDDKVVVKEKAIVNYKDPEPLEDKYSSQYFEFGMDKKADFSNGAGSLQYMDLKKALTITKIVDENKVEKRNAFKSLKEIKKHREKMDMTMTSDELNRYHEAQAKEQAKEERRILRQMKKDEQIRDSYAKNNHLLSHMVS
jgi:curved DNA-binding protein CbpA